MSYNFMPPQLRWTLHTLIVPWHHLFVKGWPGLVELHMCTTCPGLLPVARWLGAEPATFCVLSTVPPSQMLLSCLMLIETLIDRYLLAIRQRTCVCGGLV